MVAGGAAGTPATGTMVVAVAATAGAAGLDGDGVIADEVAGTLADVAAGGPAGDGAGAGSNTGAAATGAPPAWPGAAATGAAWLFTGGERVSRCPGQIVYGAAIPFHCARSRKSTPLRNAIEYSVSPFATA